MGVSITLLLRDVVRGRGDRALLGARGAHTAMVDRRAGSRRRDSEQCWRKFFRDHSRGLPGGRVPLKSGRDRVRGILSTGVIGAIAVIGLAITPHTMAHEKSAATGIGDFASALTGILSWPCDVHWGFVIIQAPLVALVAVALIRRWDFPEDRWFPIIMGAAYVVQWLEQPMCGEDSGLGAILRFLVHAAHNQWRMHGQSGGSPRRAEEI